MGGYPIMGYMLGGYMPMPGIIIGFIAPGFVNTLAWCPCRCCIPAFGAPPGPPGPGPGGIMLRAGCG
eukprot:CAMPEP_0177713110 /NCGR_PEP_ID=MMETSP0484_2-20121128/12761_1 /TAXON_ID=354590 /ORGANISM="Rhodomonas lens, Strain RHODO" /LENGTH=66 /DNA_ID=CAMNT_0019224971 /DNA_START=85 /DNA_END=281 /DNA_ORIENTATION=-